MSAKEYKKIFSRFGAAPSSNVMFVSQFMLEPSTRRYLRSWKSPMLKASDPTKRFYAGQGQYHLLELWSCSFLKFNDLHVITLNKKGAKQLAQFFIAPIGISVHGMSKDLHAEFIWITIVQDVMENLGIEVGISIHPLAFEKAASAAVAPVGRHFVNGGFPLDILLSYLAMNFALLFLGFAFTQDVADDVHGIRWTAERNPAPTKTVLRVVVMHSREVDPDGALEVGGRHGQSITHMGDLCIR
ncbi:hypothetical protein E2562_028100 [Oryza meyeriana var. granulata]|uniref:Uncharacterized protein n=1 Tax=Oryza meyeriana var. granulata TaxID=110450 RepID=A0A6G1C9B4_9ORYZ|nr:hypothetical protein E2562_028100 [Oryza meyeriana var. granulata]